MKNLGHISANFSSSDLEGFKNTILSIFYKHAPVKRKYIYVYGQPFIVKRMQKVFMKRYKLDTSS